MTGRVGPLATCEQTLAAAAFIVQSSLARSTPLPLLDHHSARARARRRPSALGAHRCSDRLLERGRAINHRAKWTCGVRFHLAEGPHRWPSRREPSERGGRSSWRLSGTATTTPIVGVSRRRPLLVPPRSHDLYPRHPSYEPRGWCPRASGRQDPTGTGRWPRSGSLVVVDGLVGCWGVAG